MLISSISASASWIVPFGLCGRVVPRVVQVSYLYTNLIKKSVQGDFLILLLSDFVPLFFLLLLLPAFFLFKNNSKSIQMGRVEIPIMFASKKVHVGFYNIVNAYQIIREIYLHCHAPVPLSFSLSSSFFQFEIFGCGRS